MKLTPRQTCDRVDSMSTTLIFQRELTITSFFSSMCFNKSSSLFSLCSNFFIPSCIWIKDTAPIHLWRKKGNESTWLFRTLNKDAPKLKEQEKDQQLPFIFPEETRHVIYSRHSQWSYIQNLRPLAFRYRNAKVRTWHPRKTNMLKFLQ